MLGLLPWEKWLPPWIFGPILVIIGVGALVLQEKLAWWELVLMPLTALYGAWGTWEWFSKRRNVFRYDESRQQDK